MKQTNNWEGKREKYRSKRKAKKSTDMSNFSFSWKKNPKNTRSRTEFKGEKCRNKKSCFTYKCSPP